MKAHRGMRPQDIVVLVKILVSKNADWRHLDLAIELGMSQSEVSESLERSKRAGLIDPAKRKPFKTALTEFLLHGLRYVFPAELGPISRGMATAHSAPPLSDKIVSSEFDQLVWPDDNGSTRGQSILPLYPSVPSSALKDSSFYELLALIDSLRIGRSREQKLAAEEISRRIQESK